MNIEHVDNFKFLGIMIASKLTWINHKNYVGNKLSRICGVMARLKQYVPMYILKTIYNSLFLSHVNYGISTWGFKDVVTPYTHISEASRYILYTIILTFDGICTIS